MTDAVRIRCSSLPQFPDCPRRHAARTFKGLVRQMGYEIRQPPGSIGASVGSAVHRGAEHLLTEKAGGSDRPNLNAATDAAIETLHARMQEDDAQMDKETPSQAVAERQVARMTQAYATHLVPEIEPLTVEQRLEARISWAVNPLILSGQSDVLAREPDRLRDLKTGKMRSAYRPQFGGYSLLARTFKYNVVAIAEDFVQRTSLNSPQPPPRTFLHDVQGCEQAAVAVLKQIDLSLFLFSNGDPQRGIEAGDPASFPANPSSKLCSERWCPAWGTKFCREHETGADDNPPLLVVKKDALSAAEMAVLAKRQPGMVLELSPGAAAHQVTPHSATPSEIPEFLT